MPDSSRAQKLHSRALALDPARPRPNPEALAMDEGPGTLWNPYIGMDGESHLPCMPPTFSPFTRGAP